MLKILASALAIGCLILASYVYANFGPDDSDIAKNPPERSVGNEVAGAAGPARETTADAVATIPVYAEFGVLYENLDQLVEKADFVIEGEVIDVSYFDHKPNTPTMSTKTKLLIEVKKSYSPEIEIGEVLTFSEPGGITTQANIIRSNESKLGVRPITEAEENSRVKILFGGRPLTKVGETYVYFAFEVKDLVDMVPGTDYGTIGAYQGQFKIQNGEAERYDPEDLPGDKYSSLKMGKVDFDKKLSLALKNER